MFKRINALRVRQNLGQVMNEVAIKDDEYIVERAGKPLVAIIPITKYQQIQDEKGEFFEWIGEMRERTKNMSVREVEKTIEDAVHAIRKPGMKAK